ncbi:MAG: AEC family transporter [Cyanobacteria bacterium P01_H01_bin.15]
MNELDLIALLLPTMSLLLIGRFIIWRRFLKPSDAKVLSKLFLYIFFPALILKLLPKEDFTTLWNFKYVFASIILILILYAGVLAIHIFILRRSLKVGAMAAYAGTKFSAGILGVPVLLQVIGQKAIVPTAINVILGYFIILPLTFFLLNFSSESQQSSDSMKLILLKTLRVSITDPIIVATLIGLSLSFGTIELPLWLQNIFQILGGATTPVAMIAVGMAINVDNLKKQLAEVSWMSGIRVILSPALALFLAQTLNLSPVFAIALILSFGLPTSQLVLPTAEQYGVYEECSAGITTLSTLAFLITWPIMVWLSNSLWPGVVNFQ